MARKKKKSEELSQEEVSEETPLEESLEEIEEKEEKVEEEVKAEELPKEEEYTKERFDGLMAARQQDRRDLLEAQRTIIELKQAQKPKKSQEDVWVDYLWDKMEAKRKDIQAKQDEAAKIELKEATTTFPDLSKDDILETALRYKTNLMTAANILQDVKIAKETGQTLTAKEAARKRRAGKIAGKPGVPTKPGLTPYDPKLTLEENIERGRKELGM